jgi:deoxypyrimidine-specific 5' nucleotidase type C protein (NT5C)
MKDKAAVGADLYIEDSPSNVAKLRADGHNTIVFSNSTNLALPPPHAKDWKEAEAMIVERRDNWLANLHNLSKELSGE